jgi:diaminopimelate epimerase
MRYYKMNGCGNDFVIFDARDYGALAMTPAQARAIADRQTGVGCDQVIAIERSIRADAFVRFWNASGEEVAACGNGSRAVAWLLMQDGANEAVKMETLAGMLGARAAGDQRVTVDMGSPLLKWEEVPVARAVDTVRMDYAVDADGVRLDGPGGVNMGNPHAVFFVDETTEALARALGPVVEHDPFFPQRVNVGFAQILDRQTIRLKVWERGAGLTLACGTGACAAAVAAHRAGHTERAVRVIVDGGELEIDWRGSDDRVQMTGPVVLERTDELAAPHS